MKIRSIALSLAAAAMTAAVPAHACFPEVTLAQVDETMATVKLSRSAAAQVEALRARMSAAIDKRDMRAAASYEAQAMRLMGFEPGPATVRGGACTVTWIKRR